MPNYIQKFLHYIKGDFKSMEYASISSRKNEKIIYASKLCDKKHRDREKLFFTEGSKLLGEVLLSGLTVTSIFFTQKALEKYSSLLESAKAKENYLVTDEVFAKLTQEEAPQGIFAIVQMPERLPFTEDELRHGSFLILEDVQNPLNIGAIFRCAYSLGTDKIVLTRACADVYNTKVLRAAMGIIFKTRFYVYDSLDSFIRLQQQYGNRVICTALSKSSKLLGKFEFKEGDSIIIGNEGNGIKQETLDLCRHSIIIPMLRGAESLNAATACSVVLWEMNKSKLISLNTQNSSGV